MYDLSSLTPDNYHYALIYSGYKLIVDEGDHKQYEKIDAENSKVYSIHVNFKKC